MFKKNKILKIILLISFIILGFFLAKDFMIIDDVNYVFPSITKDYVNSLVKYIGNYGLFRPLGIFYYFIIFEIYVRFPPIAHLIPLIIFFLSAYVLFKVLINQGFNKNQSLIAILLYSSLPFAVENIAWLSASNSIFVLLIFFFQILLIEKNYPPKRLLMKLFLLQLISIMMYETTIFMPFSLAYLLYKKNKEKNLIKLILLVLSPLVIYYLSKIIIKHSLSFKDKFLDVSQIFNNWFNSLSQLKELFFGPLINDFWIKEFVNGIAILLRNPIIIIVFFILIVLTSVKIFINHNDKDGKENNVIEIKTNLFFWFSSFLLSIAPLTWQEFYIPFRTLTLPFILLIILIICIINFLKFKINDYLFQKIFSFISYFFVILVFIFFFTIQISMINQYSFQYKIDKKITLEINTKLEKLGFEHPYRSNLLLTNFFNNNLNQVTYGEYIYGLYSHYWTTEAILDLNSGSFAKVAIEIPTEQIYSSSIGKEELLDLRPLTIMSFTNNETCVASNCLTIEAVYR